jgi:type I restriction enzyme R subunit
VGEEDVLQISLATLLRGTCEKGRLLDLVENFTRFVDSKGGVNKLLARNHQFHGVNRAVPVLVGLCTPEPTLTPALSQGRGAGSEGSLSKNRMGVFWQTQGSGKNYSMVFFAEKVFRKLKGNWTFVVITDRTELDT